MERRSILQTVLAAVAMQTGTRIASSHVGRQVVFVPGGEDRFHQQMTISQCKRSGKDTNGALAIFGGSLGPRGGVPSTSIAIRMGGGTCTKANTSFRLGTESSAPGQAMPYSDPRHSSLAAPA